MLAYTDIDNGLNQWCKKDLFYQDSFHQSKTFIFLRDQDRDQDHNIFVKTKTKIF